MDVSERNPGDLQELDRRIAAETNAKQRDRYRAVRLALDGTHKPEIQRMLGRSKRFVEDWVYAYRDHGLDRLTPKKQPGRKPRLNETQQKDFKQKVLNGPTDEHGVCTLRGKEIQSILKDSFGVEYSLNGVYALLHRLDLSCLSPRPQHRKSDPQAMDVWREQAPFLSKASGKHTPRKPLKSGSKTKPASVNKAR